MTTTPKTYQAQLPLRNTRIVKPVPMPRPPLPPALAEIEAETEVLREKFHAAVDQIMLSGFWYCRSCEKPCGRVEDDHGMPATCDRCGSPRIYFVDPIQKKEIK